VADVKNIGSMGAFEDSIDDPVDVRLAAIEQMPETFVFGSQRAAVGEFFEAQDCFAQR